MTKAQQFIGLVILGWALAALGVRAYNQEQVESPAVQRAIDNEVERAVRGEVGVQFKTTGADKSYKHGEYCIDGRSF